MIGEMYFPLKNGNRGRSFNIPGIQFFKGTKALNYVVRETIQNITDARSNSEESVKAVFNVKKIPSEKIPGYKDLEYALKSSREHTLIEKGKDFFDNALQMIKQPDIPVLVISDYNTTGLTGVSKKDKRGTRWHNLILSEGSSNKDEGSGGSYGLGKNASFALSKLRTVFYCTKTQDGEEGFKGISELVVHPDKDGNLRFGTGFFGISEENNSKAILDLKKIDDIYYRDKLGTDIYIFGFEVTPDWDTKVIEYVLDNFLVAIKENNLVVEVKDQVISSETLADCFKNYNPKSNAIQFYNALTSPDNRYFSEKNFLDEFGEVELYLLSRDNKEISMPNRVALTRKTGMRIKNKKYFPRMYNFAGVFIAKSDELNEFLRQMEPPRHDDWKPDLYEDNPQKAEKVYTEIKKWINDRVNELYESQDKDEVEVEWMNDYFPMDLDDKDEDIDSKNETEVKDKINDVEVIEEKIKLNNSKRMVAKNGLEDNMIETGNDRGSNKKSNKSDNNHNSGNNDKETGNLGKTELKITKSRILSQENNRYEFLVEFNKKAQANLEFNIIGDIGKEKFPIKEARIENEDGKLELISINTIGPVVCHENKSQVIIISLKENLKCAVEVSAIEICK